MVLVQADFNLPTTSGTTLGTDGFTSALIPTSIGRFTWNVLPSYLAAGAVSTQARIFLAEPSETNVTTRGNRIPGPRFELVTANGTPNNLNNNGGNNRGGSTAGNGVNNVSTGANPVAIALPVVFGVLTLCFLGFCVWFKRRHPDFLRDVFAFRRRRWPKQRGGNGSGGAGRFGFGRSKSQRLRGEDIKVINTDMNGLRMNAMAMNGDRDRNVFREEMRRQERARY